jgi:hypothetical protein
MIQIPLYNRAGDIRACALTRCKLNGITHYLGTYVIEQEANQAAIAWRAEHMPFAVEQNV